MAGRLDLAVAVGAACCVLFAIGSGLRAEPEPVDLELVLAIDVSSSVDDAEFELQMRGISEAFRNPDLVDAIRSAGNLGLAVSLVQWSGQGSQATVVDWMRVDDYASAAEFARRVDLAPRQLVGGQTSIADALIYSVGELMSNPFEGARQVIDLSGDGRANVGPHPMEIRDQAVAAGITVNGIAILKDEPFLDSYFAHGVIGGVGAFMMTAEDYEDFTAVIMAKLLREIGIPITALPPPDTFAARDSGTERNSGIERK